MIAIEKPHRHPSRALKLYRSPDKPPWRVIFVCSFLHVAALHQARSSQRLQEIAPSPAQHFHVLGIIVESPNHPAHDRAGALGIALLQEAQEFEVFGSLSLRLESQARPRFLRPRVDDVSITSVFSNGC